MGGGNAEHYFSPLQPSGQAPFFGGYHYPGQHPYVGENGDHPWRDFTGGGHYHPYFSNMSQDFQQGGWQTPGNIFSCMPQPQRDSYQGMDGYHGGRAPDPGILVYDNIVTGDPRTVVIGEGNRARGQVRGKISGNCIFRS